MTEESDYDPLFSDVYGKSPPLTFKQRLLYLWLLISIKPVFTCAFIGYNVAAIYGIIRAVKYIINLF